MKFIFISLFCLILASCINTGKVRPTMFSDKRIEQWEKVTIDKINNIYDQNRNTKIDTFELNLLGYFRTDLYNHQARQCFVKGINIDTTFLNSQIDDFILIESQHESRMYFIIICKIHSNLMYLSFENIPQKKAFKLYEKGIIENKKYQAFINEVKMSNLFKNQSNNGEYYNGTVIVSLFSKDKIEVFPYLTFNFSNAIYRSYNEMFE